MIVLLDGAAVFVDGRYTVQVRQQVSAELFEYRHLIDEPHADWLGKRLGAGKRAGFDPRMHTLSWQKRAQETLARHGVELVELAQNPVDLCWHDRPAAQVLQTDASPDASLPAGHGTQAAFPTPVARCPAGHGWHDEAAEGPNVPAGHDTHAVLSELASWPTPHATHSPCSAS
jgi:hypothetical protein